MAGVSSKDFFEDTEKQDAVIRRIEIIGEATAHLFRQMRGMRNIVAHDYGHADVALVWKAATEKIPLICRVLDDFLGNT